MDAPKPDPISLIGPQVVVDGGGYARVIGYAKNISNGEMTAGVREIPG
jgi:hypothetical protein